MMGTARRCYVYIMASRSRVLYTGVTSDLARRDWEHKERAIGGFTSKYHVRKLVHWEEFSDVRDAIAREKEIKGWRREKKVRLVEGVNPGWRDLAEGWPDG